LAGLKSKLRRWVSAPLLFWRNPLLPPNWSR